MLTETVRCRGRILPNRKAKHWVNDAAPSFHRGVELVLNELLAVSAGADEPVSGTQPSGTSKMDAPLRVVGYSNPVHPVARPHLCDLYPFRSATSGRLSGGGSAGVDLVLGPGQGWPWWIESGSGPRTDAGPDRGRRK
jgi:hypothetical protein